MENEIEKLIAQLALRVRLFRDSTGRTPGINGLGERELTFLEYLELKGESSFSDLTAFFKKVSASTVSNSLKKLYKKGLVERKDDPNDLRAKIFAITEKGCLSLESVKRNQMATFRALVEFLQLTSEEAEISHKIILRSITNFDLGLGLMEPSAHGSPAEHPVGAFNE